MANGTDNITKPDIDPNLVLKYKEARKQMDALKEAFGPMTQAVETKLKELYKENVATLLTLEGKDRVTFSFDAEDKTPIEVVFKVKRTSL
ncbi:MAG TPA: hypothetical protein DDX29_01255 [Clostridiales bacterium]|nr:hypothetical protein [Clostridiales bacterium]